MVVLALSHFPENFAAKHVQHDNPKSKKPFIGLPMDCAISLVTETDTCRSHSLILLAEHPAAERSKNSAHPADVSL